MWWVGARKRKKSAFFVLFSLSEGNFFNICVSSPCIVYWIQIISEYFYISKNIANITSYTFLLAFKIVEAFSVSLIWLFLQNWISTPYETNSTFYLTGLQECWCFMISETKIDSIFPSTLFFIVGYALPFQILAIDQLEIAMKVVFYLTFERISLQS